jgi:hypothetical protein
MANYSSLVPVGLTRPSGPASVMADVGAGLASSHFIYRAAQLGAFPFLLGADGGQRAIDTVFGSVQQTYRKTPS